MKQRERGLTRRNTPQLLYMTLQRGQAEFSCFDLYEQDMKTAVAFEAALTVCWHLPDGASQEEIDRHHHQ